MSYATKSYRVNRPGLSYTCHYDGIVVNLEICFANDPRVAKDAFYNCNNFDKTRLCYFSAEGRVGKIPSNNLRSSTSNSRSSRAPYHASRRSIRRSVSSTSLDSMAGKDGDHIDDELSGEMSSEHSSALTENIIRRKAVNKVTFCWDVSPS